MSSLWRFVSGSGWVLQPVPTSLQPEPASHGCVITPETAQGFGFRRILHWVRKIVITAALVLTTAGLVWMWHAGHQAEVTAEVVVAVFIVSVTAAYREIKRFVHPGGVPVCR
ncbi:hypothetical protein [Nocardia sp. NPDC003354]